jgi:AbrB family looped-hinge helix DNA binding protein
MIISLKQNSQITIPKSVVEKLKLKTGDSLNIEVENDEIKLKPVLIIDRTQAWYWSKEWQNKIKDADLELITGKAKNAKDVNDLIKQLAE